MLCRETVLGIQLYQYEFTSCCKIYPQFNEVEGLKQEQINSYESIFILLNKKGYQLFNFSFFPTVEESLTHQIL